MAYESTIFILHTYIACVKLKFNYLKRYIIFSNKRVYQILIVVVYMYIICNILDEFLKKKKGVRIIFMGNMQFAHTARSVYS